MLWETLLGVYALFPFILTNSIQGSDCQSKHFHFMDSFVSRDGHLTLFWTMGCKNESLEDLGITFAFPDPGITFSSLLVPSPLECKWELVEQIPMGDLNRLELSSLPLDILSLWLGSCYMWSKATPNWHICLQKLEKFYGYIIWLQL